jgi:hypothetical protein
VRFQVSLFGILASLSVAAAQQGTADAIVVKIPASGMASAITLSAAGGIGAPGKNLTLPISLTVTGSTAPASWQADLLFDATKLTFASAAGLSSTLQSAGDVHLSGTATGSVTFTLSASFGTTTSPLSFATCKSADSFGNPLSTGCVAGSIVPTLCNVTGDSTASVTDVQTMVKEALGLAQAVHDFNQDGTVTVADVQKVMLAALGKGCS